MSSFYGQMRWQDFQRFFYNFTLTNQQFAATNAFNKGSQTGFGETVEENIRYWLQPNEDFATLKVNAADHWIKLCPMDSLGDSEDSYQGFSIFHNEPAVTNLTSVHAFEVSAIPNGETATILKSGDSFKILEMKFDKAGHFSESASLDPTYFQLPPQIIRVNWNKDLTLNTDQKFYFVNDDELIELKVNDAGVVLNFEHKKNFNNSDTLSGSNFHFEKAKDEGTEYDVVRRLEGGDYISTFSLTYDTAGHVTELEKVYYQLPISEADERLDLLEETVAEIQADLEAHLTLFASYQATIDGHVGKISNIMNFLGMDDTGTSSEMQNALNALQMAGQGQTYTVSNGFNVVSRYIKEHLEEYIVSGLHARILNIEKFLASKYNDFSYAVTQ